ncbi:protein TonB-like [Helianthus annuus]|uniref:protein TonB-like n=1 Tax=Helianthus annuus TaxID=4232 RepID=UPI000B8FAF13|nr:protein TonB-like [Helianthus annuus]
MANSLSTPLPSSQIPPSITPLFDAIEIQTQSIPSHKHIKKSTTSTMAVSEPPKLVIPQTAEEKHDMKKFGKPTPRQKPTQKPEPENKSSATSAETSVKEKEKGIEETLNIQADEEAANKKTIQNQNATKERIWKREQKELRIRR